MAGNKPAPSQKHIHCLLVSLTFLITVGGIVIAAAFVAPPTGSGSTPLDPALIANATETKRQLDLANRQRRVVTSANCYTAPDTDRDGSFSLRPRR